MSTETLPGWFWVLYYSFFISSLLLGAVNLFVSKEKKYISIVIVLLSLTVPVTAMINSIGRPSGNEFEHLLVELLRGQVWALFVSIGIWIILYAWFSYIRTLVKKRKVTL